MVNKNVALMRGEPEIAVKKLAIPIMISMILTALYNIIDGIWVAGLGPTAIAGIGFVTPIFMVLNGASVGLGNGATSSISRFIGAKNHEMANKSATHSLFIFLIASIILTIIFMMMQKPLLVSYGASGQTLNEAIAYATPLFLGLIGFMFSNGCSGILRGEGDMKRAMYVVILTVILNAILDPLFIYTIGLGSAGASLATIASSSIAALVMLYWILVKKDTYVNVTIKKFKLDMNLTKDILKVGIPSSLDMLIMAIAMSIYLIVISQVGGDYGIATFTSGQRLYLFAIMPLTAIGSAVIAVSGSAFGAKNGDYLSRTHIYGSKFGLILGTIITLILVIFATPLSTLFAYTPETTNLVPGIALYLQVVCPTLILTGIGIPSSFFYQGIGKGIYSLMFTILREIIFVVPLIFLFVYIFHLDILGIWLGLCIGRAIASTLNYIFARYEVRRIRSKFGN
ncbi:putative efflux protein, MATE family [Methanobrevibacter gottschalkii]|uniref:Putative MATE family efflux protein n=2 Tax=Methanobrevibacter gottschalkii TaxID=190974 RepID=A0A3N5C218_9EURY|nr:MULTISPECIES: MATE family efflux transporter [Methanobrevibacter]MCQ2970406.1 MATE family efflux transporter [archaeon]OED01027.1 MATE family efflux transporter [Methanobrevibacter sp. A27]RPF50221.1 putative MATE family efflux protein [Methanobrevibacter gottschalkii DSM 11977]SEL13312.1 putative efflux protein, MATE family [Methanobrevibacter gottschalkii]